MVLATSIDAVFPPERPLRPVNGDSQIKRYRISLAVAAPAGFANEAIYLLGFDRGLKAKADV